MLQLLVVLIITSYQSVVQYTFTQLSGANEIFYIVETAVDGLKPRSSRVRVRRFNRRATAPDQYSSITNMS